MRVGSIVSRGLTYFRRYGFRATLRRVVDACTSGSADFIITRIDLRGPPVPDHVGDVVLRLATPADGSRLAEIAHGTRQVSVLQQHIARGDWVFLACHGERPVAARILTRDLPEGEVTAKVLTLRPDQVWDDDMFCLPEYRGKGIARQLSLYSDRYLGALGFTETFARISTSNIESLRMQRHKGSEFAFHVSYRHVLGYKRLRVSADVPAGRPGSDVIATLQRRRGERSDPGRAS